MTEKDYYKTLEVEKKASQEEIKRAFRQLARKYHPDVNQNNKGTEDKFKEINEAFQILGNEKKRAQYDLGENSSFSQKDATGFRNSGFNFEDLFSDLGENNIFNIFNRGRNHEREDYEEGADLRHNLEITLEEAFYGIKKTFEMSIRETCKKCNGAGVEKKDLKTCSKCQGAGKIKITIRNNFTQFSGTSSCDACRGFGRVAAKYCENCEGKGNKRKNQKIEIAIPRGINSGQYLRIAGKGDSGKNAQAGDLYVIITIMNHPVFKREGEDLFLDKKIDLTTAIFGGSIDIQGIDKTIKLKIPKGTESHTFFKLKNQGMPFLESKKRGDLFVRIFVEIPKLGKDKEAMFKKLLEKQKEE